MFCINDCGLLKKKRVWMGGYLGNLCVFLELVERNMDAISMLFLSQTSPLDWWDRQKHMYYCLLFVHETCFCQTNNWWQVKKKHLFASLPSPVRLEITGLFICRGNPADNLSLCQNMLPPNPRVEIIDFSSSNCHLKGYIFSHARRSFLVGEKSPIHPD